MPAYGVVGTQFRAATDIYTVVGTQFRRVTEGYAVVGTQFRKFYEYNFWSGVQVGDIILGGMFAGAVDNIAIILWHTGSSSLMVDYWANAEGYCRGLTTNGYSDWRFPTVNEWGVIHANKLTLDAAGYRPALTGLNRLFWTSTVYDSLYAYAVDMVDGVAKTTLKATTHPIRAIRRVAMS